MATTLPLADPPVPTTRVGSQLTILRSWLDVHRQSLRWKVGGLTPQQAAAAASVDPFGLSLLGLVRHLTDCERWWFRGGRGDLEELFPEEGEDRLHATAESALDDLARFEEEVAAADVVLEGTDLDAQVCRPGTSRPPRCAGCSSTWSRSTRGATATRTSCGSASTGPPATPDRRQPRRDSALMDGPQIPVRRVQVDG